MELAAERAKPKAGANTTKHDTSNIESVKSSH